MSKKIILSGIQSTGNLTLGNYLGAINNWTKMQEDYDCHFMIANLHTLTIRNDPETLRQNTLNLLALYIASGINPEKSNIFIQSQVASHAELAWVLNCYTYMGELSRMTQFKDKSAKHADNINSGLFTYPVLMAADILLYQADLVPVGEDQKQHLEITRDIAERFNKIYGQTFKIPEPYVQGVAARVMGLQDPTSKMSKSSTLENDSILLNDEPEVILKKFKKSVTDSENIVRYDKENKPGISNLITIYSAITGKTKENIEKEFEGKGYGDFKTAVANCVIEELKPIQEKYKELKENPDYLEKIFRRGAERAYTIAHKTLEDVYKKIGMVWF
ncbi:MAG: tryptophan--tRNA ligase [Clostridia bacterium]|nr:tryptophan--tRNA ligase [Clostridia bacterium]